MLKFYIEHTFKRELLLGKVNSYISETVNIAWILKMCTFILERNILFLPINIACKWIRFFKMKTNTCALLRPKAVILNESALRQGRRKGGRCTPQRRCRIPGDKTFNILLCCQILQHTLDNSRSTHSRYTNETKDYGLD